MRVRVQRTTTGAPQMPITLEDVKTHLKVDEDSEDAIVYQYMIAAIRWAEERTRRAIARADYLITADDFPYGEWFLPLGKIQTVTRIQYIDTDGATQTWNSSEYETDLSSDFQARIRPAASASWPSTGDYFAAARVEVSAGWDAADVPYTLRQALLMKVADLYEIRAPGDPLQTSLDTAAEVLLSGHSLPYY